jgi:hypothetical protein
MTPFLIEALFYALASGICAAVYRGVLAYEPVLQWWFKFGNRFEGKWFFAPIWGCIRCISGQIALWAYVLTAIVPAILIETGRFATLRPPAVYFTANPVAYLGGLIIAICGGVFVGMFANRALTLLKKAEES